MGKGRYIVVPYSKKLTNGEINISKYSGLVSVIKRRSSSAIANEWSKKIFGKKFSNSNYTSKIPAVIARHTYVYESMKKIINIKNKSICDFGAGEGDFLKIFKKNKITTKLFGIEPSKDNCKILKKNKIRSFEGTIEDFFKKNKNEKFDIITLIWTLCNTADCYDVIRCASKLLKKNGYIVIAESSRILVPYKKPIQMYFGNPDPDSHPFHFSKNSLTNLLILNKFNPIFVNRYIDSDYLVIVAKKTNKILKNKIILDKYKNVKNFFISWYKDSKKYKSEIL
jgi:ubiquinone/menaquinone biosynthesis C-methylase UbiE